jgi:hypothetical protein
MRKSNKKINRKHKEEIREEYKIYIQKKKKEKKKKRKKKRRNIPQSEKGRRGLNEYYLAVPP